MKRRKTLLCLAVTAAFLFSSCAASTPEEALVEEMSEPEAVTIPYLEPSPSPQATPTEEPESEPSVEEEPEEKEPELFWVQAFPTLVLYDGPEMETVLAELPGGSRASVTPTEDPMWVQAVLEDGSEGWLCTECLFPEDGETRDLSGSQATLFQSYFEEKTAQLQELLPQDRYWNHMGDDSISWGDPSPWSVTDVPCDHDRYGESYCNFYDGATEEIFGGSMDQCLGFASLLSDQYFGEGAPLHVFYDPELLRVGDHIRLKEYEHSAVVVSISEEGITLGEVNQDYVTCRIDWTRQMSWEQVQRLNWDSRYISRYPLMPDGQGGFVPWE